MKNKSQLVLAVGAGYLLGRRKMRLALVMGTAAATGGFGGVAGQLLRRGTKLAGSDRVLGKLPPEFDEISEMLRGDLLDAGKAAGTAAVRSRIDRISDKIHDQAEMWRQSHDEDVEAEPDHGAEDEADPGSEHDEAAEEPVDTAEEPDDDGDARDEAEDYEDTGEPDDAEAAYEVADDGEMESRETEDLPARSAADGGSRRRRPERTTSPVRRTRR